MVILVFCNASLPWLSEAILKISVKALLNDGGLSDAFLPGTKKPRSGGVGGALHRSAYLLLRVFVFLVMWCRCRGFTATVEEPVVDVPCLVCAVVCPFAFEVSVFVVVVVFDFCTACAEAPVASAPKRKRLKNTFFILLFFCPPKWQPFSTLFWALTAD